MFALDRTSRAVVVALALASFAAAFATTPIVARGEATPPPQPLRPLASRPPVVVAVLPRRDPFAAGPLTEHSTAGPAAANLPPIPAIPAAIGPLPPNAGAAGTPLLAVPAARVTAVVTGAHPFALVEEAGATRIVTTGDRLASGRVVAIGADGVHLDGGATLAVAPRPGDR